MSAVLRRGSRWSPATGARRARRLRFAAVALLAVAITVATMRRANAAVRLHRTNAVCNAAQPYLVVQSLNVFGLPWPAGTDVAKRCGLVAASIRRDRPDLVALQEVWDGEARTPLLVDDYDAAYCESPDGLFGQSGLLTLSRHPIVDSSTYRFTATQGIEAWVGKGALRTVVQIPGSGRLAIWNVHLQAGAGSGDVRSAQIRELAGWIEGSDDENRVVLGDFNCGPGQPEWQFLLAEFTGLGLERRSGDRPTYDCLENPLAAAEPPSAIDHVFIDAVQHAHAPTARRAYDRPIDGTFASDHFGLEILLPSGGPRR